MAKYLVETYYNCSFKVSHYLDKVDEKELSNLENRDDGKFEILDIKLDTRKTKSLEKNQKNSEKNTIETKTESIKKQQFQISTIEEGKNPLARKINLNRYNKEEETLNYLKTFEDEFKVADNSDPVPSQRYIDVLDPVTGEVIGIEDTVQGVIRPV